VLRASLQVDDDVDDALTRMPATPVTTSVIRSSSVPPRLPARGGGGGGAVSLASRRHVTRTDSHVMPPHHPVYEKVVYDSRVTVRLRQSHQFTKFSTLADGGRDSVTIWRRCDTLYTFFISVYDVTLSQNGAIWCVVCMLVTRQRLRL